MGESRPIKACLSLAALQEHACTEMQLPLLMLMACSSQGKHQCSMNLPQLVVKAPVALSKVGWSLHSYVANIVVLGCRGLLYCMEYLEDNLDDWLAEELEASWYLSTSFQCKSHPCMQGILLWAYHPYLHGVACPAFLSACQ